MRDKHLIYWLSLYTEVEYDLLKLSQLTNQMDLRLCSLAGSEEPTNSFFIKYNKEFKKPYWSKPKSNNKEDRLAQLKEIARENPDLIIIRFGEPYMGYQNEVNKALDGQNYWLWTSEQGSKRYFQEGIIRGGFDNILVNNKVDLDYYKRYENKKIKYLPFCCIPEIHKRTAPKKRFKNDCIADGVPRYHSSDTIYKKVSIDTLIAPLVNKFDIGVWGYDVGNLGWKGIDWIKDYYRGIYPYNLVSEVYSSCKIYLGITNNWYHGGYGKKLATALACGIFVLWHCTKGLENDFEMAKDLVWSSTPKQTINLVEYYLENNDEREKIALEGQKYAYEHLDWEKNILRIVEETK